MAKPKKIKAPVVQDLQKKKAPLKVVPEAKAKVRTKLQTPQRVAPHIVLTTQDHLARAEHYLNKQEYIKAQEHYIEVWKLEPKNPEALHMLGALCMRLGSYEDGVKLVKASLEIDPNNLDAWLNFGYGFDGLEQHGDAVLAYEQALKLSPMNTEIMYRLAVTLRNQGDYNGALRYCEHGLAHEPESAKLIHLKGCLSFLLRRPHDARYCFHKVIELAPDYHEAYNDLGNTYAALGHIDTALSFFNEAIRHDPDNASYQNNAAMLVLLKGDFANGWRQYESRWETPGMAKQRRIPGPQWNGTQSLQGKSILLYGEQGAGDVIQFLRYLPMVRDMGATVYLGSFNGFERLFATLDDVDLVLNPGDPVPPFDYHCPLASLPFAFKTDLLSIPIHTPYIYADPKLVKAWKRNLGPKKKPRVGVVWSGNPNHPNDHNRSLPLELLKPLLSNTQVTFYSLQREVHERDSAALAENPAVVDLRASLTDYAETAAIVENLDLVITVDTSVAHLAAALGKPVWILVPFVPDWRWLLERTDSPWYNTVRLFRQEAPGHWQTVIQNVAKALENEL